MRAGECVAIELTDIRLGKRKRVGDQRRREVEVEEPIILSDVDGERRPREGTETFAAIYRLKRVWQLISANFKR